MNTNAPQAHIDNARNKLSTLLNQLCAADHATTETTVESITKVANTLHYLCQPSSTYGYSNAPGPSPEVGESPSTATASPDASPEPTPDPVDAEPDTIDRFLAALRKAAENCPCPLCTARRQAAANAQAEAGAAKPSIGGDMSASVRVVEIPIDGATGAVIARALGLNG